MCFFGKGMKKRRNGKNERKGKRGEREWGKVEMKKGSEVVSNLHLQQPNLNNRKLDNNFSKRLHFHICVDIRL